MLMTFAILGAIALIVFVGTFVFAVYVDRRHVSELKKLKKGLDMD